MRGCIFLLLFFCFFMIFMYVSRIRLIKKLLVRTENYINQSSRKRLLSKRNALMDVEITKGFFQNLDEGLTYSGLYRSFPGLNIEKVVLFEICFGSFVVVVALTTTNSYLITISSIVVELVLQYVFITICRFRNLKAVENQLLKFLDFLGNYGTTVGELTSIFSAISRYMDEPLSSVLNECYYEAHTTGDTKLALLTMANKIEHIQFKEIIRNLEIGNRYLADYKSIVRNSKKTVREYIKAENENRTVILEAAINIVILLILSMFIMLVVENMTEMSIVTILFMTWPGRLALAIYVVIFFLFLIEVYNVRK